MPPIETFGTMTDDEQAAFLEVLEGFFVYVANDKRAWSATIGTGLPYQRALHQMSRKSGIPPAILLGFVRGESGGNPRAVSRAGARGLMQLMPTTGAKYGLSRQKDFFLPQKSLRAGAMHLRDLLDEYTGGCWSCAAMTYNYGQQNLEKTLRSHRYASAAVWYAAWIAHNVIAVLNAADQQDAVHRSVTARSEAPSKNQQQPGLAATRRTTPGRRSS